MLLDQGYENEYNIVVSLYFVLVVVLIASIALMLWYIDGIVLNLLKLGGNLDNASRSHAAQFAKQIRLVSRLMNVVFVLVVLISSLIIALQVTLHVYPYRFLLWLFVTMSFPLFGAACLLFAKFSVRQEPSSNSNNSVRISSPFKGGSSAQVVVSSTVVSLGNEGASSTNEPTSLMDAS